VSLVIGVLLEILNFIWWKINILIISRCWICAQFWQTWIVHGHKAGIRAVLIFLPNLHESTVWEKVGLEAWEQFVRFRQTWGLFFGCLFGPSVEALLVKMKLLHSILNF